jgi:hypothetical protein
LRCTAAFLHENASGRINYNAPTEKITRHGEGSDQLTHTVLNSRPRHTGVSEAAGAWRMGTRVYELCSFRLMDSSVTLVTLQRAFLLGGRIPPLRLGDGVSRHLCRPRERNCVLHATNIFGLTVGLCGLPTRDGIGPDQLQRTDREKYHAWRGKRTTTTHRRK